MSLPLMAMEADSIRVWRHFMKLFAAALVAILAVVYALILLIDPYDSGQLTGYAVFGVVDESPRTANVSRGRDTQFNSAVIGNSRGQLLDPKRLSHNTGLRFVQLTVPGTGPREQLTLLRWFIRHHRQIGAILLIADPVWCSQDPEPSLMNPFPFWLYTEDTSEYLINVFHTQSLQLFVRPSEQAVYDKHRRINRRCKCSSHAHRRPCGCGACSRLQQPADRC